MASSLPIGIRRDAIRFVCISGSTTLMEKLAQQNQSVEVFRALLGFRTSVTISGNFFQRHCHLWYQNQKTQEKLVHWGNRSPKEIAEGVNQCCVGYAERDFFHVNEGSSKLAACRYTLACSAALSFPCSISSTVSEGAIQFFALTRKPEKSGPVLDLSDYATNQDLSSQNVPTGRLFYWERR